MRILFVETFYKGSHKSWANQMKNTLDKVEIEFLTDDTSTWKEAMTSSVQKLKIPNAKNYDLVIVSSMVNLVEFQRRFKLGAPHLIYFHENQIAYPWTKNGNNDKSELYSKIQLKSALLADHLLFNSKYNLKTFCSNQKELKLKSTILPLGINIDEILRHKVEKNESLTILWNHRWEYDKNPVFFFEILKRLKKTVNFKLILTGESPGHVQNKIFTDAKAFFEDDIIHFGYAETEENYYKLLWQSHLSIVTSNHDFFGLSVCESVLCEVYTLLPNRLAYPEHFLKHDNFYDSKEELYQKIEVFLKQDHAKMNHRINEYDWNKIHSKYYEVFQKFGLKQ